MKKKINKVIVEHLATEIMLDPDLLNIDLILEEFADIFRLMDYVKNIETTHVSPLEYPLEEIRYYLRADDVTATVKKEAILDTAPVVEDDFVIVNEVVS